MTDVVTDLNRLKEAVTAMGFARIDQTGAADPRWVPLLETIDATLARWEAGDPAPEDLYRLGMLVGMVGTMTSCRVTADGTLEPGGHVYPDNPVAQAVAGMQKAVLAFSCPA